MEKVWVLLSRDDVEEYMGRGARWRHRLKDDPLAVMIKDEIIQVKEPDWECEGVGT